MMKRNLFEELKEGFEALIDERENKITLNKKCRETNESTQSPKTAQQDTSTSNKAEKK